MTGLSIADILSLFCPFLKIAAQTCRFSLKFAIISWQHAIGSSDRSELKRSIHLSYVSPVRYCVAFPLRFHIFLSRSAVLYFCCFYMDMDWLLQSWLCLSWMLRAYEHFPLERLVSTRKLIDGLFLYSTLFCLDTAVLWFAKEDDFSEDGDIVHWNSILLFFTMEHADCFSNMLKLLEYARSWIDMF